MCQFPSLLISALSKPLESISYTDKAVGFMNRQIKNKEGRSKSVDKKAE